MKINNLGSLSISLRLKCATKDMIPDVPVFPQEIIEEVLEARRYGVSRVHLHARDKEGVPTYCKNIYK